LNAFFYTYREEKNMPGRKRQRYDGGDMGDDDSKADISTLLTVNQMDYRLPPSLSIATSRASKTYPSRLQNYKLGDNSRPLSFTVSTGAHFVDWKNSYLRFSAKFPDGGDTFIPKFAPYTGWLQSIRGFKITHSSGVELERVQVALGPWLQLKQFYDQSSEERGTVGSLSRYNNSDVSNSVIWDRNINETGSTLPNDIAPTDAVVDVCIPLCKLSGFFNNSNISPGYLAAGLQIDLWTYTPEELFVLQNQALRAGNLDGEVTQVLTGAAPPGVGNDTDTSANWPAAGVVLENPVLVLDTFAITDSIVRKISQISASDGLEWDFTGLHHQGKQSSSSTTETIQIQKAISRANNIVVKSRRVGSVLGPNRKLFDTYGGEPWIPLAPQIGNATDNAKNAFIDGTMLTGQVQLGAQYIPSTPLETTTDFMHSAYKTFGNFRRSDQDAGPSYYQFTGHYLTGKADDVSGTTPLDGHPDLFTNAQACLAVPLENSSTLAQSGAAISAQRTAVVNIEFKAEAGGDWGNVTQGRIVDTYLEFTKVVTLFLDSVVVRS
jgi:hypothetical protein